MITYPPRRRILLMTCGEFFRYLLKNWPGGWVKPPAELCSQSLFHRRENFRLVESLIRTGTKPLPWGKSRFTPGPADAFS